jgi:hypothetical protein
MKKKALLILSGFVCLAFILIRCNSKKKDSVVVTKVTPVPLPTNIVPGFNFPEDSNLIYGWINDPKFAPGNYDSASIYKHAWGVWAGLTAPTDQVYAGDKLLVYETWMGLSEVQQQILKNKTQGGCAGTTFERNGRAPLSRPKQFEHAIRISAKKAGITNAANIQTQSENAANFWVTVSYSPGAACFATQNQIFRQSVINKYYNEGGLGAIPPFPNNSLTIKPTYLVFDDTAVLFKIPAWITAPPSNAPDSNFFANTNTYVYADPGNKQPKEKVAVPVNTTNPNSAQIEAATINLSDFISLKIDQQMADFMNKQDSVQGMNNVPKQGYGEAKAGQIALLVAMHVTTKEINNWTWQSYYWTPNRNQPGAPSSNLAASLRPSQITGAAANYACVAAYVMLTPNNAPNKQANGPMFGYNPYLEGGFGPTTFNFENGVNGYDPKFKYGVQSNCMSCHALAIPFPVPVAGSTYTTDQTIDLKNPAYFNNQVSLDFAWSIQTALINDTLPYWVRKK